MKNVEFKVNLRGINKMMKSPEIQAAVAEAGEAVAKAAGDGYTTTNKTGRYMPFCNVEPATKKAKSDNYENNTLLKAIGNVGLSQKK